MSDTQLNLFQLQPFPPPVLCFGGREWPRARGWEASLDEACAAQRRSDEQFVASHPEPAKLTRHQLLQSNSLKATSALANGAGPRCARAEAHTLCRKHTVWLTTAEALAFLDTPEARELRKLPDVHWRSTLGH